MAGDISIQIKLMKAIQTYKQHSPRFPVRKVVIALWTGKCLERKHTGNKNEYYQQYWFFHNILLVRGAVAADDLEPTGRQKQFLIRDLNF